MPSIYDLKPSFQALLRPLVRAFAAHGITANQVTVAAIILSALNGELIAWKPLDSWPLLLLPFFLLLRMGLNAIDGMLAREHNQQSKLGAILNELGDVLSDTLLYLPLSLTPMISAPLMVSIVMLSIISEMSGIIAVQIGAKRQYKGPMGKSDRAFWLGTLGLSLGLGLKSTALINGLLSVILFLLFYTIFNRLQAALKEAYAP